MALLEEALYTRLAAFAGLAALVTSGSITRIYPVRVPQNAVYPLVSYNRVSGQRIYAFGIATGLVVTRMQVSSWDKSYSGVKAVAEQVRLALSNYAGVSAGVTIDDISMISDIDLYEEDTKIFQVAGDFSIDYRETP